MRIIVFEVKGGGISYEASLNEWYSLDRNGDKHTIKEPVDQAKRNRFALRDKLFDLPFL